MSPRIIKTPFEKLQTKIQKLLRDDLSLRHEDSKISVDWRVLFSYDEHSIRYSKARYYPTKIEHFDEVEYEVIFPLSNENLRLLSTNITKPPTWANVIADLFYRSIDWLNITKVIIWASENSLISGVLSIKKELYETIIAINKEESKDKRVRFTNRTIPFLSDSFWIQNDALASDRDYSTLLEEIIASGNITQQDIIALTWKLEEWRSAEVVIEQQINKQAGWLIDTIQEILDEWELTKQKAKDLWNEKFWFPKSSIKWPEHLMERILSKYWKHTLFGVPVLLDTDKYVTHSWWLSNSQFDLILIDHLWDIEVVELKRSDTVVLEYDQSRSKFYASKDLAIAISQAERYISAVYHNNDEEYKIKGLKIRDYLQREVWWVLEIDICRPRALIILWSQQTVYKDYSALSTIAKTKISRDDYNKNGDHAYKELRYALKNIRILTYSELLDHARARFAEIESNQE